jgi:hypothetical protein
MLRRSSPLLALSRAFCTVACNAYQFDDMTTEIYREGAQCCAREIAFLVYTSNVINAAVRRVPANAALLVLDAGATGEVALDDAPPPVHPGSALANRVAVAIGPDHPFTPGSPGQAFFTNSDLSPIAPMPGILQSIL